MKTKTLRKKLSIKKHTVADLTGGDMKNIVGGYPPTFNTRYTCQPRCTITCYGRCIETVDCIIQP